MENEQVLAPVQVTRRCSVFQNGRAYPTFAKSQKPWCEQGLVCKPQHIVMYLTEPVPGRYLLRDVNDRFLGV